MEIVDAEERQKKAERTADRGCTLFSKHSQI